MIGPSNTEQKFVILSQAAVALRFWHEGRPLIYPPNPTAVRTYLYDDPHIFMRAIYTRLRAPARSVNHTGDIRSHEDGERQPVF